MEEKLSLKDIEDYMQKLGSWELGINEISRRFEFEDFRKAVDFADKIAELAEKENHHPTIIIEHNYVTLKLSTHAASGLTRKDFVMAQKIEEIK